MSKKMVRILSVSDQVVERMYSPHVKTMFSQVDLILSCGDLPYFYLEYILDMLNAPMYFVRGNHDPEVEIGAHRDREQPWGAENIHTRVVNHQGLLIAGFEGCVRYSNAKHQYTQSEVWLQVLGIVPKFLWNRLRYGRFVDILLTHSPAMGLGDSTDPAHIGFKAYRWLIKMFRPKYHLHGHVHIYDRSNHHPINFRKTTIINVSSFYRLDFLPGDQE